MTKAPPVALRPNQELTTQFLWSGMVPWVSCERKVKLRRAYHRAPHLLPASKITRKWAFAYLQKVTLSIKAGKGWARGACTIKLVKLTNFSRVTSERMVARNFHVRSDYGKNYSPVLVDSISPRSVIPRACYRIRRTCATLPQETHRS